MFKKKLFWGYYILNYISEIIYWGHSTSLICHKIQLVYEIVLMISFKFSCETEILFKRRVLAGSVHDKVCQN